MTKNGGETSGDVGTSGASAGVEIGKSYSITALSRAILVLNAFTLDRPSLGLKEVVAATGLPKTTVFRLLSTLIEHDFCAFDEQAGEYTLGFAVLRLGEIRRRQTDTHSTLLPAMREMRDALNETVVLSVRAGDDRVHIDALEAKQSIRRTVELGSRAPLYTGAASKILLAGLSDEEIEAYLARTELVAMQGATITDPAELWREIRRIRERGYAESRGELIPGGGALAAPVRDFSGRWVAAIDILTPNERYTPEHREKVISVLLEGVGRASARLGHRA